MDVAENLNQIKERIRVAEQKFRREKNAVRLLAVSKTYSAELMRKAYHAGQNLFGESYLQEALEKQEALQDCSIEWHFVGSIQSNKTKHIATRFSWVHSVNRFKIAKRLSDQRPEHLPPLNVCIEVNISGERSKSGVKPEALVALASEVSALSRVRLRGLMVIPEYEVTFEKQLAIFKKVAAMQQDLVGKGFELDVLSMGMSQDFEAAIAAGATIVRIGTALFLEGSLENNSIG